MFLRQSFADALRLLVSGLVITGATVTTVSCGTTGVRSADTALYVRTDTDDIVVYAPRAHVGAKLGDSFALDATYAVDVWTGASIDVVTAATTAIHEVRHEVNASAGYEFKRATLSGNYRYSTENDYWSNGGVLNLDVDMADNNTTLSLAALGSMDIVGTADDPLFRRPQDSIGGRIGLSQVLDTKTVLSLSGEMVRLTGFLASPYRAVGVGGPGLCGNPTRADPQLSGPTGDANECLPENHPHERLRTALALKLRRAFGSLVSMGVQYRYYFDNWGIDSHTATPDLSILIGAHGTLSFSYRFYWQSRSDFYEPRYTRPLATYRYFSRDRKMSQMLSHHAGAEYVHDLELGESASTVLQLGARAGLARFVYSEFIGLDKVDALELTGSLGLLFR